jgi:hypothetical protein
MEMAMTRSGTARLARRLTLSAVLLALPVAGTGAPAPARRLEVTHPAGGHEVHVSAPAVAEGADGPVIAWVATLIFSM